MEKKRVLVAMSGGTDSSAACMLLQEQGYEIEGITMRMWEKPSERGMEEPPYIREARLLAERLQFPHHVLNIQEDFRRCVVNDFIGEYMHGRTPNPCVQCNIHIKMKYLIEEADRLGCDYVATGHYARITEEEGVYYVEKGADVKKDQSYFLWGLGQEVLSRMIFPLGGMTKEDARNVARRMGFVHIAEKSESQDICFVDTDYRDFLRREHATIDEEVGPGNFVDIHGKVLGRHKGFPYYTIGQRKGLEIALGEPMYVLHIDAERNEIMIGRKEYLQTKEMRLRNCNFPLVGTISNNEIVHVKIRYKSQSVPAYVERIEGSTAYLRFVSPIEAITPGQSGVLYRNDRVIGGGIICE